MSIVPSMVATSESEDLLDKTQATTTSALTLASASNRRLLPNEAICSVCLCAVDEASIRSTSSTISTSMHSDSLEFQDFPNDRDHKFKQQKKPTKTVKGAREKDEQRPVQIPRSPITLQELSNELIKRECSLGRYCHLVSQSYKALGDWYFGVDDPGRSIIMYRANHRISIFLYGSCTAGYLAPIFQQALIQRGIPEIDFASIQNRLSDSVHFEMNGDMLRQFGMAQRAALEYQKAIKVEEAAFGRENPCLATLWRKLACLVAVMRSDRKCWTNEIDEMDRLDDGWLRRHASAISEKSKSKLHEEVWQKNLIPAKFGHAINKGDQHYKELEFSQAVSRYSHAVAINKTKRPRSNSRSKSRNSRSRSRSQPRQDSNADPPSPRRGTRETKAKLPSMESEKEQPMRELEKLLSDSRFSAKEEEETKEKQQVETLSTHQTVVSTSRRVKRSNSNSSTRSMYQAIKQYMDPQRPKSDSHVASLAKKVALKTSKHIRKSIASGSNHRKAGHTSTKASFKEPNRHKTDAYSSLASPPMTPLVDNTTVKLNDMLKKSSPSHRGFAEIYDDGLPPLAAPSRCP
jgi:tetratricopeptide (TPR) repeat protein